MIAALLHDAIEDQELPRGVIAQAFGEGVANLMEEVTDDKNLEKQERKRSKWSTRIRSRCGQKFSNSRTRQAT